MDILYEDLLSSVKKCISSAQVDIKLFAPYAKANILAELISSKGAAVNLSVITAWRARDFAFGASDPQIYEVVERAGGFLYYNNKIHLKTVMIDFCGGLTGSANLTNNALRDHQGNHETLVVIPEFDSHYRSFLQNIISDSTIVTQDHFDQILKILDEFKGEKLNFDSIDIMEMEIQKSMARGPADFFRISELPLSSGPDAVISYLFSGKDEVERREVEHDVAIFLRSPGTERGQAVVRDALKSAFFKHPFICKIIERVESDGRKSISFGGLKQFVQSTCTDDPVPSRRDLSGIVSVLMNWFPALDPMHWAVSVPGTRSEVLFKIK